MDTAIRLSNNRPQYFRALFAIFLFKKLRKIKLWFLPSLIARQNGLKDR
jgi:hypothetical protein